MKRIGRRAYLLGRHALSCELEANNEAEVNEKVEHLRCNGRPAGSKQKEVHLTLCRVVIGTTQVWLGRKAHAQHVKSLDGRNECSLDSKSPSRSLQEPESGRCCVLVYRRRLL
jgi:hypothetical protein